MSEKVSAYTAKLAVLNEIMYDGRKNKSDKSDRLSGDRIREALKKKHLEFPKLGLDKVELVESN